MVNAVYIAGGSAYDAIIVKNGVMLVGLSAQLVQVKHYSLMLEKVAKTEVQKEFYTKLLEFHKKLLERIEEDE